jgi:hypothetical protein
MSKQEQQEKKEISNMLKLVEKLNKKYYGAECKDWEEGCCVCQIWKAYNVLKNEYEK